MNTVYYFRNNINGKMYIGSTVQDPVKRKNQHIYLAFNNIDNIKYNYPLYQAFRKYGIENFSFEILDQKECSDLEIRNIERDYIIKYNTLSPNGYNQTLDTINPPHTEESNKKISETKRENAKKVAEINDNCKIIKIWRCVADCAEETGLSYRHIADCCRGERKTTGNRKFCWINESDELILPEYKSNSYKGDVNKTQHQKTNRKVAKIDMETGEILDVYDSVALAARMNNIKSSSNITKVCRGKSKFSGGFFWKYADELEE